VPAERTWHNLELPEGAQLVRKELFEYSSDKGDFIIELFENVKGEYYAIGTPRHSDKLIIYGSPVMSDSFMAMQTVIEKIEQEGAC
jgi:hypothetical protein